MILILLALFATPEAERDPAAWATRYAAHVGVGAVEGIVFPGVTLAGCPSG